MMTDHPHAKLLEEAQSHSSEPPIYAYVTDDKLEGMFDNELRHSSGKKPYDYLKGWLSMLRPFAYATQDNSWGEMEKLLMIVMRNYIRRTRLLSRLAAALAAASPSAGEGWVLVPREPHFRQCAAGRAALGRKPSERVYDLMGEIYAAMIAAAPSPPADEENDR